MRRQAHRFVAYEAEATPGAPLCLIFPGIDATGKVGADNAKGLSQYFNVETMVLDSDDRTGFDDLVNAAVARLQAAADAAPGRALLVGESMGATMVLGVALKAPHLVGSVVVANPATAYARAPISLLAPLLPRIPAVLYESLPAIIAPLLGKPGWFDGLGSEEDADGDFLTTGFTKGFTKGVGRILRDSKTLSGALPAETLQFREAELVRKGAESVNAALERVGASSGEWDAVFVAGDADIILPSVNECLRLKKKLGRGTVVVEKGAAHVALDGLNVPLLLTQHTYVLLERKRGGGPAARMAVEESSVEQAMEAARVLVSPVFFSTALDGTVERGLAQLPLDGRPVILVGNHQLFGVDAPLLIGQILRERQLLPTSIAFPSLLEDVSPLAPLPYPLPGSAAVLRRFGAVPAGARNLLKALKTGSKVALLFPGGGREVFKRKNERYQLRWPSEATLARVAAKLNATVVPFSGVGGDDFFAGILADSDELLAAPVIGPYLKEKIKDLPSFVPGDVFVPPLVAPRLDGPPRHYFLFGKPMVPDFVPDDAAAAEAFYADMQANVEAGMQTLLDRRGGDPYERALPRFAYEAATRSQAPTFAWPPAAPAAGDQYTKS
ncbi:hypothetical protein M885DRAFT_519387 [Pelagophyceae sp. CCMP2097]|nr:hypothetical protein M885DRAFT_519387 [Pelagophyceae sp. CCMP2097]